MINFWHKCKNTQLGTLNKKKTVMQLLKDMSMNVQISRKCILIMLFCLLHIPAWAQKVIYVDHDTLPCEIKINKLKLIKNTVLFTHPKQKSDDSLCRIRESNYESLYNDGIICRCINSINSMRIKVLLTNESSDSFSFSFFFEKDGILLF